MPRQLERKYSPIWERLKAKGKAVLECNALGFKTIKKGVIKEKDKDIGFKVANDKENFRLKITYDPATQRATFILKATFGLEDIVR